MKAKWFVIDEDGNVSYSAKTQGPESFASRAAAVRRAKALADTQPGVEIHICKTDSIAVCSVLTPVVTTVP